MAQKKEEAEGAAEKGSKKARSRHLTRKLVKAALAVWVVAVWLPTAVGPGLPLAVNDILMIIFLTARYFHEGLPLDYALRDAEYMSSSMGRSPLFEKDFKALDGLMEREMLRVQPGDDHITALCKVSMYTQMVTHTTWEGHSHLMQPGLFNLDTFDPVPTIERVNSYVQACVEVYSSMDKDSPQRKILDKLPPVKREYVSTPNNRYTNERIIAEGHADRYKVAASRESLQARWKDPSELGDYGHMYTRSNIRPVKEEIIEASEIAEAVRQGKVALFDATKLLGKELFNLTMPQIAAMHGDLAKQIPMYRQKGATAPGRSGIESLESFAKRIEVWKKENSIRFPEHAPFRPAGYNTPKDAKDIEDALAQPTWWLEVLATVMNRLWFKPVRGVTIQDELRTVRSQAMQCAVNTRRLPKLPMPKMEDALGNPDWLERAWSMFWLGPVSDCWHYDDPDNLLISVYGDIWVTVFTLKDREIMRAGADRGCWSPMRPMPLRIDSPEIPYTDTWLEKFEFIQMKLEPGMGIVVPSGAFHSLAMADGDRILLNCFMIPKYKGLWDAPAANYSFYSSKWQTEEYAALSSLKKSSIFRLWDTKQLGGYFEGSKLEML